MSDSHEKFPPVRVPVADVPENGALKVDIVIDGIAESAIITKRGEHIAAFLNRCPHARWPLDTFNGRFLFTDDGHLICAAHTAIFDAVTGQCLGGPGTGAPLTELKVVVAGNVLMISSS